MQLCNYNDIKTSSLGFGCSLLTRHHTIRAAIDNLNCAFESGITHFDVANVYGFGQAETILGKFANGKRDRITITTKTGLQGRQLPLWALPLVNRARAVAKKLVQGNGTASAALTNMQPAGSFNKATIVENLNNSLKKIKTDYIDFYLLHEATIGHANNEEVIDCLDQCKKQGKIRYAGIASYADSIKNEYGALNSFYKVVQHNDSPFTEYSRALPVTEQDRLRIIYNIFSQLPMVQQQLAKANSHLKAVDGLLHYFHGVNKDGITLFASTQNNNIKNTAAVWSNFASNPDKQYTDFLKIINS
jgi:aryl-alcohol dehydrogenase-like predicted oxidoreductase